MLYILWAIAILLAIASALLAYFVPRSSPAGYQWVHWCIVVLWTLGPATWFLLDATFRIQPGGKGELTKPEEFFYDAAAKFWAAVVALLLAIYSKDQWLK